MDLYLTSLALGGVGLGAMAMSGFLHHAPGHGHTAHGHTAHGHTGPGHTAHGHTAQAHTPHGPAAHSHAGVASGHSHGDAQTAAHGAHGSHTGVSQSLMSLMSPRVLFSVCLGLGTTGLLLRGFLGGPLLFLAALAGGVIFNRVLVTPIWNFAFRFESNPALTLESATGGEATAVSSFDANGQGLIAIDVDGQIVQVLGTLRPEDRAYRAKVPAGTKLRVEDVDAARNRCTVSLL
jgi:hypothetical protein